MSSNVVATKIPPELECALREQARVEGISPSAIIRRALRSEFYDVPITEPVADKAPYRRRQERDGVT
jgi:hypothetical protein